MNVPFNRIVSVGDERLDLLTNMLNQGESANAIATLMQESWGESTDISTNLLAKQLERYKDTVLDTQNEEENIHQLEKLQATQPVEIASEYGIVAYDSNGIVDAHALLQDLVVMQKTRLDKVYKREKLLPSNMEMVRRDITVYGKLLEQLVGLQLDLGYLRRAPIQVHNLVEFNESVIAEAKRVTSEGSVADRKADVVLRVLEIL